ncbi:MAG: Smr/MutS family protein [Thiomicrorhabdus sp.]|jgi:DNA-nicking Smr family endonuclease|nr:Smr/MutS family protein [Thiomicrorhabdus sp.]
MTEEDKSTFLSAMTDVTPIKKGNVTAQYNPEKLQQQAKETLQQLRKRQREQRDHAAIETRKTDAFSKPVSAFETLLYHQKGIRLQELSKLKKGEFEVSAELDLHGLTLDDAKMLMHEFIREAYHLKKRYIRIIHGKGYNSRDEYPVLKNLVNQELKALKAVIAFSSAPARTGGTGAVNVFLKAQ